MNVTTLIALGAWTVVFLSAACRAPRTTSEVGVSGTVTGSSMGPTNNTGSYEKTPNPSNPTNDPRLAPPSTMPSLQ